MQLPGSFITLSDGHRIDGDDEAANKAARNYYAANKIQLDVLTAEREAEAPPPPDPDLAPAPSLERGDYKRLLVALDAASTVAQVKAVLRSYLAKRASG